MKKSANAYAKINLYLDIVCKRDDGYHDIKGIMQKISLCDKVTLSLTPAKENKIKVSCSSPLIPTGKNNIAYRAAEAFLSDFCKECYSISIDIEKNIPAAGGLAGGSTDAAAVLSIMRELLGVPSDLNALMPIAAKLGADVPFCLANGSMITEGIGEILTSVPSLDGCFILIANSGESVSTPHAYASLDSIYGNFKKTSFNEQKFASLCEGLEKKNLNQTAKSMYNIFEGVVLSECKGAMRAKEILVDGEAVGAMMSGSGSTVFGLFDDKEKAIKTESILKQSGYITHISTPIS